MFNEGWNIVKNFLLRDENDNQRDALNIFIIFHLSLRGEECLWHSTFIVQYRVWPMPWNVTSMSVRLDELLSRVSQLPSGWLPCPDVRCHFQGTQITSWNPCTCCPWRYKADRRRWRQYKTDVVGRRQRFIVVRSVNLPEGNGRVLFSFR